MRLVVTLLFCLTGCAPAASSPDSATSDALQGDAGSEDAHVDPDAPGSAADAAMRERNSPGTDALLDRLRGASPMNGRAYDEALAAGVTFTPTSDGDSFVATWRPDGFDPATGGIVVALHGHDGFVALGFDAWEPFLRAHGLAFLGLQWWFGGGETTADYYLPHEIYPLLLEALDAQEIPPGRALFEGFSRGSANSYAVVAMDRASGSPRFALAIANAGGAVLDYPPTAEIVDGRYGASPFAGTRWVLYCGALDPEPEMSGCPAMRRTETWMLGLGASIEVFLEDPTGRHGGFHQNPENAEAALGIYETLLGT